MSSWGHDMREKVVVANNVDHGVYDIDAERSVARYV